MDVELGIWARGGIASRRCLLSSGIPVATIDSAVRARRIRVIRRGWYALPTAPREVVDAVRAGGSLSCGRLLDAAGVWVLDTEAAVHVALPANASRIQAVAGVVRHWTRRRRMSDNGRDSIPDALAVFAGCVSAEAAIAAIDSALRQRLTTWEELLVAGVPAALLDRADPSSESGLESLVRLRLRSLRIAFRMQVWIAPIGRVDFLIGDRLVLEVDGYAHHGSWAAFESDRARDLALSALGFLVIRVSYRQVREDWDTVADRVLALVRRGQHRGPVVSSGVSEALSPQWP